MFTGSVAVYVVVAACSAAGGGAFTAGDAGHNVVQDGAKSGGQDAFVSGDGAKTRGVDAVAVHDGPKATGIDAVVVHDGTTSTGQDALVSRDGAKETSVDAIVSHDGPVQHIIDALTDPVREARADNSYQSGTRIKVQRYVGADGSSQFVGMYDSQLNTPCNFETASDGKVRCLPTWVGAANVAIFFANSGCSTPLAYTSVGCAVPTYAYSEVASCGTASFTFFNAGSSFTGTVYSGTPSACSVNTSTAGFALYSVGTELPPSTFAQATLTTDP